MMNTLLGKNILVTGAAGFIGSHLCDWLQKESTAKIVGVDNLFLGKKENLYQSMQNPNFNFINGDVANFEEVEHIITKFDIDMVYHLAVLPLEVSIENPTWCFDQNIRMTQNILEVIRMAKRKIMLIAFSTSEVYGTAAYTPMDELHPYRSHTPYAASKVASDQLVYSYAKTFGLDFMIIRPFNNFGPRQNEGNYAGIIPITIRRIMNGEKPVIFDDGKQTRDFIFVEDTAYWTLEATKCDAASGKMINMASGRQVSVEKVIRSICKEMGYDGEIEYRQKRPGDVKMHEGDMKLAKELFSFKNNREFEEGIRSTVDWYRNHLKM